MPICAQVGSPVLWASYLASGTSRNGVRRPPVVFCKGGDARLVVRRETFEDLVARDVE